MNRSISRIDLVLAFLAMEVAMYVLLFLSMLVFHLVGHIAYVLHASKITNLFVLDPVLGTSALFALVGLPMLALFVFVDFRKSRNPKSRWNGLCLLELYAQDVCVWRGR